MRDELATLLHRSTLKQARDAALALEDNWPVEPLGLAAPLSKIQSSVSRRFSHLASQAGQHAQLLASSLQELLSASVATPDSISQAFAIHGPSHSYLVYSSPEATEVHGCLRTVGKGQVSDAAWQALWHDQT